MFITAKLLPRINDTVLTLDKGEVNCLQVLLQIYKTQPRFMGQEFSDLVNKVYAVR